jgi:hypothetical protein
MGFPYGITWEEMEIIDREDLLDDEEYNEIGRK